MRQTDPYAGMQQLFDDPTDWCVCAVDSRLFPSGERAADFMRIFCFDHPGVPVVQINAAENRGPADLTLAPGPDAEVAGAILGIAYNWFPGNPVRVTA